MVMSLYLHGTKNEYEILHYFHMLRSTTKHLNELNTITSTDNSHYYFTKALLTVLKMTFNIFSKLFCIL